MQNIRSRVSYLQGLVSGLDIDNSTKEGRILNEMVQLLGDVSKELEELRANQAELESYLETLDEDLYDLEGEFYGTQDDMLDIDEENMVKVRCPECHDLVYFDADLLDDDDIIEITCPQCETVVYSTDDDFNQDVQVELVADTEDI